MIVALTSAIDDLHSQYKGIYIGNPIQVHKKLVNSGDEIFVNVECLVVGDIQKLKIPFNCEGLFFLYALNPVLNSVLVVTKILK